VVHRFARPKLISRLWQLETETNRILEESHDRMAPTSRRMPTPPAIALRCAGLACNGTAEPFSLPARQTRERNRWMTEEASRVPQAATCHRHRSPAGCADDYIGSRQRLLVSGIQSVHAPNLERHQRSRGWDREGRVQTSEAKMSQKAPACVGQRESATICMQKDWRHARLLSSRP
jgi:hypothetical protein